MDGNLIEDAPAQLAFSAVRVPAGFHRIEWRERAPGVSVARWGPLFFALAVILILVRDRREGRTAIGSGKVL